MTAIAAIPTKYRGLQFRSRLEAQWAAFFDLLEWPWEYEPLDLNGYIPDFVLLFEAPGKKVLVEVKPALDAEQMKPHMGKIIGSGWADDFLIVGATGPTAIRIGPWDSHQVHIGLLYDFSWSMEGAARIGLCRQGHWGFDHDEASWACRVCGTHKGITYGNRLEPLQELWHRAKNLTQWRGQL